METPINLHQLIVRWQHILAIYTKSVLPAWNVSAEASNCWFEGLRHQSRLEGARRQEAKSEQKISLCDPR